MNPRSIHVRTLLMPSWFFSAQAGCRVSLKLENTQPSGSFKLRGIGRLATSAVAAGARQLVSSSGGNAGLAAAWSARALGVSALVVVPETTSPAIRSRLEAFGAQVEVHGSVWDEADIRARALSEASDAAYVPPFDHPEIWAGHATLVDELAEDIDAPPSAVAVAVGGGGLFAGVVDGLRRVGWNDVPVLAAETHGAASLAAAVAASEPVALARIDSVAHSLGARRVARYAFECARSHPVRLAQVSDADALSACRALLEAHHVLVEPACGAVLAAVTAARWAPDDHVVVVLCGGSGVSVQDLGAAPMS